MSRHLKLSRQYGVFLTLEVTAKDTRIDTQWSAELSLDRNGNLAITLEEIEVYED